MSMNEFYKAFNRHKTMKTVKREMESALTRLEEAKKILTDIDPEYAISLGLYDISLDLCKSTGTLKTRLERLDKSMHDCEREVWRLAEINKEEATNGVHHGKTND